MKEVSLFPVLVLGEMDSLKERYHFSHMDMGRLKSLYQAMEPLVRAKAYIKLKPELVFLKNDNCVISIVTLGKYVDELENLYSDAERLLEAYMIECLSLEILSKAYEGLRTFLHEETGMWMAEYGFLGDQYPIERMGEILDCFSEIEVSCKGSSMMTPRKSVILISELTEKDTGPCDTCLNCGNRACPNRDTGSLHGI